jgi:hypothetical protein
MASYVSNICVTEDGYQSSSKQPRSKDSVNSLTPLKFKSHGLHIK